MVPRSRAYRPFRLVAEPSVYIVGDATAVMVSREFMRSSDGIAQRWLPGEPSGAQLVELMKKEQIEQTNAWVWILFSRKELSMGESERLIEYRWVMQMVSTLTTENIKIVAPLPYPGMETPALKAGAILHAECRRYQLTLMEPTEQFLVGKTARPELFYNARSLSPQGTR
uniref:Uncharacterized protein n=1 Tax=Plectus sambesii TaxID=2011161 RepID=A0A914VLD0_9BILA